MANPDGTTEARGDDCNLELNQVKRQLCCSENKAKPKVKSPNRENQGSEKNQRPSSKKARKKQLQPIVNKLIPLFKCKVFHDPDAM